METAGKLYRYLVIHEAYRSILESSGKMAKGLSRDYIYGEIALMTHSSRRTIQRALNHKPITMEQIERMR